MSTNRKRCNECKKRKMYVYFHKKADTRDGYCNMCKQCKAEYNKQLTTDYCDNCGEPFWNRNGHTLCVHCRRPARMDLNVSLNSDALGKVCNCCKFEKECEYRVKVKKNANWLPYCFIESQYHEAWKEEYESTAAAR